MLQYVDAENPMGLKIESFQSGWSSLLKLALAKELAVKTFPRTVYWLSELSEKLAFNVNLIQNDGSEGNSMCRWRRSSRFWAKRIEQEQPLPGVPKKYPGGNHKREGFRWVLQEECRKEEKEKQICGVEKMKKEMVRTRTIVICEYNSVTDLTLCESENASSITCEPYETSSGGVLIVRPGAVPYLGRTAEQSVATCHNSPTCHNSSSATTWKTLWQQKNISICQSRSWCGFLSPSSCFTFTRSPLGEIWTNSREK